MPKRNTLSDLNPLIESLTFDGENGVITAAHTDWLLIRASVFRDLLAGIALLPGVDPKFALETIGKNVGKGSVIQLAKQGYKPTEIPAILALILNLSGWGKVQLKSNLKSKSGYFSFENRSLARDQKLREAYSRFVKGFLEGLTENLTANVNWLEKTHNGDSDLVCEFYFDPKGTKRQGSKK